MYQFFYFIFFCCLAEEKKCRLSASRFQVSTSEIVSVSLCNKWYHCSASVEIKKEMKWWKESSRNLEDLKTNWQTDVARKERGDETSLINPRPYHWRGAPLCWWSDAAVRLTGLFGRVLIRCRRHSTFNQLHRTSNVNPFIMKVIQVIQQSHLSSLPAIINVISDQFCPSSVFIRQWLVNRTRQINSAKSESHSGNVFNEQNDAAARRHIGERPNLSQRRPTFAPKNRPRTLQEI